MVTRVEAVELDRRIDLVLIVAIMHFLVVV